MRRGLGIGFLVSLLVHVVLLAVLGPIWVRRDLEPIEVAPDESQELTVETTWEEPEPPPKVEKPAPIPQPNVAERPEPEPPEPFERKRRDRDSAEQPVNETAPRQATAKLREVDVARDRPERQPPSQPEQEERESEEMARDPVIRERRPDPQKLLMPDPSNYERVFAERDQAVREHSEANRPRKRLFEGYEALNGKVKASLQSFDHAVKPGNHTGVRGQRSVYGSYIGTIHRKIHMRWANRYLMDLDMYEPRGSPMNDPQLNTKLEFVIRADDGTVETVNIVSGSGQVRFDAQALSIAYAIGPQPNPPPEIVSPDGRVYIHWNFWRDQRQCGVFGASVFLVDTDEG